MKSIDNFNNQVHQFLVSKTYINRYSTDSNPKILLGEDDLPIKFSEFNIFAIISYFYGLNYEKMDQNQTAYFKFLAGLQLMQRLNTVNKEWIKKFNTKIDHLKHKLKVNTIL